MREEVDVIRKKAGIAYRKALSDQKNSPVVKEEPQDLNLDELGFGNPSQTDADANRRRDEEEDLDIICDFFVYGGDDQDDGADQEQIWRRLASKVSINSAGMCLVIKAAFQATCKTASSWVEFYDQHYTVIQQRYSKLVGPQPTESIDLEKQT